MPPVRSGYGVARGEGGDVQELQHLGVFAGEEEAAGAHDTAAR
jgi:hypothetical protein